MGKYTIRGILAHFKDFLKSLRFVETWALLLVAVAGIFAVVTIYGYFRDSSPVLLYVCKG